MYIIILGAGVVGFQIADNLINEGHDVAIIEKDPDRARQITNRLDCMVINDEGTDSNVLLQSNIINADFFISVTDSDEVNLIACGMVSNITDKPEKIARVRKPDYSKSKSENKSIFGIDYIVNSEYESARKIANIIALGASSDVILFEDTDLQMRNILITGDSFFRGKTIKDIRHQIDEKFLIAGIHRNDKFIIPSGNILVRENDKIYIMATKDDQTKLFIKAGRKSENIDRILIVGGTTIGRLACKYLIRTGRKITIIDDDYENCKLLSEKFSDALVLNADLSSEDIFIDENLQQNDLIITATNNQELNILTAIYGKNLGINRAAALIQKNNYLMIASKLGIDSIISPKTSTIDAIMKFIKRGKIKSIHTLLDGTAEVIEFNINEGNPIIDKPIKEIEMPEDSLMLSVFRNNENIVPNGDFILRQDDSVIVIVKKDSISKIENFLSN